jgi:hypothetical protein
MFIENLPAHMEHELVNDGLLYARGGYPDASAGNLPAPRIRPPGLRVMHAKHSPFPAGETLDASRFDPRNRADPIAYLVRATTAGREQAHD